MKTTSLARKVFKGVIKKDVMAYAWRLARKQSKEDGCTPRECLAWALRKAWYRLKVLCTARKGFHLENSAHLGSLCLPSSRWADLAKEFPNVCSPRWAILESKKGFILYVGTLKECEEFRWGSSWNECFGEIEHSSYVECCYCPVLWA